MERGFDILEHTADVGILAHGSDLVEAFANSARAMFSLITDIDDINEVVSRTVEITSSTPEDLLVDWLNELIFLFDTENMLYRRFDILEFGPARLKAVVYGEKTDLSKHDIKTGIKAATYHMLRLEEEKNTCRARVFFDI